MAFDTPRSSELTEDQLTLQNKLPLDDGTLLYYDKLPLNKRSRKPCSGLINGVPCAIFRKRASRSALNYLMGKFPEIKEYFEEVREFAPTILDCVVEHDRAFYFQAVSGGEIHELVGIMELPLWESSDNDFYELSNLIHYCRDYEDDPGNVFMDDYGLC